MFFSESFFFILKWFISMQNKIYNKNIILPGVNHIIVNVRCLPIFILLVVFPHKDMMVLTRVLSVESGLDFWPTLGRRRFFKLQPVLLVILSVWNPLSHGIPLPPKESKIELNISGQFQSLLINLMLLIMYINNMCFHSIYSIYYSVYFKL